MVGGIEQAVAKGGGEQQPEEQPAEEESEPEPVPA
jgi:hypothetical protein